MQRFTTDIENTFVPVEDMLCDFFLPDLFQGTGGGIMGKGVTCLQVKQAGLALPDTTKTAQENWTDSCVITGHLVAELRGQEEFKMEDHATILHEARREVRRRNVSQSQAALEENLTGAPTLVAHCLWRVTKTGAR